MKLNEALDIFEVKIKHLANYEGIDSLTEIEDYKIAQICIEALKREISKKQQEETQTQEPFRKTKIKVKKWLIDKKIKEIKQKIKEAQGE